jgi:hypothetical protein
VSKFQLVKQEHVDAEKSERCQVRGYRIFKVSKFQLVKQEHVDAEKN